MRCCEITPNINGYCCMAGTDQGCMKMFLSDYGSRYRNENCVPTQIQDCLISKCPQILLSNANLKTVFTFSHSPDPKWTLTYGWKLPREIAPRNLSSICPPGRVAHSPCLRRPGAISSKRSPIRIAVAPVTWQRTSKGCCKSLRQCLLD